MKTCIAIKEGVIPDWMVVKQTTSYAHLIDGTHVIITRGGWLIKNTHDVKPCCALATDVKNVLAMNRAIMHKGNYKLTAWCGDVLAIVHDGRVAMNIDPLTGYLRPMLYDVDYHVYRIEKTEIKLDDAKQSGSYSLYQRANACATGEYRDKAIARIPIWNAVVQKP